MPFSRKIKITHSAKQTECIPPPYQNGIVLRGYDVVEYFNLSKNQKGKQGIEKYKHSIKRGGATYTFYFLNSQNLEEFVKNPEAYIPRFGGFCSWGFANEWGDSESVPPGCIECLTGWPWTQYIMGPPADTDYGWSVYQDHLYFNINPTYRTLWEKNPDRFISRASKRWRDYFGSLDSGPLNVKSYPWNWKQSTVLTPEQIQCLED